ncbi:methyltransferase [Bacteriovorax sp. Seq25_V]|uniref:methyltransferase n=1 Tax=Bacteriovorax sp. Seq25_V TaxID=1201288 RepID=UPI000550AA9D|nr:methyltransferase [Bacteriovorax sp. Seq25_V]
MNYTKRFDQIVAKIKEHQEMWNGEIITLYPDRLDIFNQEWVKELSLLTDEQLWQVDCFQNTEFLNEGSFKTWLNELNELCELPKYEYGELEKLPDFAFNKVKGKKRHEILVLAKLLKQVQAENDFSHLVDIGGGVGHLSRVMAHYKSIECISLDINKDFQTIGEKRLHKYTKPEDHKNVTFITHDFTYDLKEEQTRDIFTDKSFSLGLHTCGPLALKHIDVATVNKTLGFINFGCCYNKLNPQTDCNISQYSKNHGLTLTDYAFTLACRGHSSMDYNAFKLKRRVKDFRYAIHIFFYKYFGIKEVVAVGDSEPREYWGKFSDYLIGKCEKLGMKNEYSAQFIDDFFEDAKMQEYLKELFLCNVIRWQYGRSLELYLLIDRCLYLQERGFSPLLLEFFDPSLSPRNIGILLTRHS